MLIAEIREAVINGQAKVVATKVEQALNEGVPADRILHDALICEKHMTDSYNTYAGECVNEQLRNTMLTNLNDLHTIQANIFSTMQQNGWYQVEPAEQVRWLNAFRAMMELSILQPTSALKIDGSAYHHGGHYHSYARGAFGSLPPLIRDLSGTPWRLSTEAHERLRRAMLAQRLYANRLDLPIALRGRSPFAPGYGTINPGDIVALGTLAYFEPLAVVFFGWTIFGETLSSLQLAGCAAILASGCAKALIERHPPRESKFQRQGSDLES